MYVPVISLRYLRRKKWGLQSIIGITIGVATLIVVVSIMRGFDSELKSRIRGTLSHITIHKGGAFFPNNYVELIKEIESLPHVEACAPYIETPAFVKIRKNKRFVVLKGIKPHNESLVGNLQEYTSNCGSTINDLSKLHGAKNNYSVLCGIELLRIGSGEPETFPNNFINKGEKLVVFCIKDWGKMSVLPFIINGMFKTNMQEYDDNYIYVPLEAAQKLVGKAHAINGISVKLDNYDYANKLKKIIQNILGYEYFVNTWEDTRRSLLRTLVLERKIMGIILFLIII